MSQYTTIHTRCLGCGNLVKVETEDRSDGALGNAGFIVKCSACEAPFAIPVTGDIEMSRVTEGATELETYDGDEGRDLALVKHGVPQVR